MKIMFLTTHTPTIKDLTQEFTDGGKSPFKIAAFDTEDAANSSERGEGGKDITITSKNSFGIAFPRLFQ
jgi:hypothetical protein